MNWTICLRLGDKGLWIHEARGAQATRGGDRQASRIGLGIGVQRPGQVRLAWLLERVREHRIELSLVDDQEGRASVMHRFITFFLTDQSCGIFLPIS